MYCPKCGQDCGDAIYCSRCGTKLIRNNPYEEINFSNYNEDQVPDSKKSDHKTNIIFGVISALFPIVGLLFMLEFRKNLERKKYCAIGTAIGLMINYFVLYLL